MRQVSRVRGINGLFRILISKEVARYTGPNGSGLTHPPRNVTINLIPPPPLPKERARGCRSETKGKTLIPITCVSPRFYFGSRAPFSLVACYTFWYTRVNYSVEIILSKQREFCFPFFRFIVDLYIALYVTKYRTKEKRFFVASLFFFLGQNYWILFGIADVYFCLIFLSGNVLSEVAFGKVVKNSNNRNRLGGIIN